jgi:hypothetical protein
MPDDFNIFTEEDKQHVAYGACVMGWVAVGATLGSMAGGQTLLGAGGGAVWALFTCKYLQQPIKRKLFSSSTRLTEHEFRQALIAVKSQFPNVSKQGALDILAAARREASKDPRRYVC